MGSQDHQRFVMSPYRAVIEFMTNHERNQWARAGYPGQHNGNPDSPKAYITDPERFGTCEFVD